MIQILDSTLRDGGYIINWNFGKKRISNIVKGLCLSKIDFIELGFLIDKKTDTKTTLFNSIDDVIPYIKKYPEKHFCLMIKEGEYNINNIFKTEFKNVFLRYIFKKQNQISALKNISLLIKKGYRVFVNPVFIDEYEKNEFFSLIKKIALLNPYAISVVDSIGVKNEDEIKEIFLYLDKIISKDISLCFHSHNNKERALICARSLINMNLKRNIIIDSTLSGMGRGAGNICSELLAQYLNSKAIGNYDIDILFKTVETELNPLFKKHPWGNSYPYYLCADYKCHCEYASFMIRKKIEINKMQNVFASIPKEKRSNYDEKLIENLLKEIY